MCVTTVWCTKKGFHILRTPIFKNILNRYHFNVKSLNKTSVGLLYVGFVDNGTVISV